MSHILAAGAAAQSADCLSRTGASNSRHWYNLQLNMLESVHRQDITLPAPKMETVEHMNALNTVKLVDQSRVESPYDDDSVVLRLKVLTRHQKEILELAAQDAPVADGLNALVRAAQVLRGPDTRAAVFIFDPQAAKLKFAASTGLSEVYTRAIDGFPVGPTQPSCGQAAYIGDDVIVRDVAEDPLWAPYRQLAEEQGIRACWSFLLRGPEGRPLGTFALYHRKPCEPDAEDYEEVRYFARIASLLVDRHILAESRLRAEEVHRRSDENKDQFLAVLAHELRNPLAALKSAVKVAQLAGDQPLPRDRALEVMGRQITQMEWLIEDLIDANRIARGELKLQLRLIELKPVLDLALETVMPQFREKQQVVTFTMPSQALYLDADPSRVTQMVTNLLTNACKFTGTAGVISLDVKSDSGYFAIHVSDNGIGLATQDRESIFKMFAQRSGETHGRFAGLGIGLALVKDLASLHGGSIEARSAGPGKGSEFVLRLPTIHA